MTGWRRRGIEVPQHHPTASGHFPGHPIVPGALLLDEVARILAGPGPLTFRTVKFVAPAQHGVPLDLLWQAPVGGLCRFEIRRTAPDSLVLTGTLAVAA